MQTAEVCTKASARTWAEGVKVEEGGLVIALFRISIGKTLITKASGPQDK